MSKVSRKEVNLSCILVFCLVFWIFGAALEIPVAFVAIVSLFVLVTIDVIEWKNVVQNSTAWDSFFWLALMIQISQQISDSGLAMRFGEFCATSIISMNLPSTVASFLLAVVYFLSMYFFKLFI